MPIPICRRGERTACMHRVKVRGARDSPNGRTLYWNATPSNANLNNYFVFQIQRHEPVPWTYLREDLFQTPGMACQASARMARGWNGCADWLHKGMMLMVGRKIFLLSFWKCMCFILSSITAVGHLGAIVGPWGSINTLSSPPSVKRGGERYIRGCLRGGPAVARLGPLLFLPGWSGGLREGVALSRVWAPSISPTLRRSGLRGGWRWFSCLLSRRRPGATGSSRSSVALREEVLHHMRQLLTPPWSVQQSPPQLVQTCCLTKPERWGKELCPPLSSPSSWARGGALIQPGRWLQWCI